MKVFPKGRRQWLRFTILWGAVALVFTITGVYMIWLPGKSYSGHLPPLTTAEMAMVPRLKAHVEKFAVELGERNIDRYGELRKSQEYIETQFQVAGYEIDVQDYVVYHEKVANVEARYPGDSGNDEVVVIGAHYDSVEGTTGADDNASGVAALLELAHRFKDTKFRKRVRWVAFVNEEPPFFQTEQMGSLAYARRSKKRGEKIDAMISIETIGYYSNDRGSQKYPPLFSLFYPNKGNFIGFVSNLPSRSLLHQAVKVFRLSCQFPSEGVAAPAFIPGVGWSDHWSFW